jgi:predicted dehydrogenase
VESGRGGGERHLVRYALAGLGGIARLHLAALAAAPPLLGEGEAPPVELAAAVVGAAHAAEAEALGFAHVQVVEEPRGRAEVARAVRALAGRADFLDICLPNGLHAAAAEAALEAGLAVYCEKPLSGSLEEARRLAERLRSAGRGRPFGVAYNLRFHRHVALLRTLLAAGLLGEPLHFRLRMFHGGYLDPRRPRGWKFEPEMARGGALVDLGSHLLDMVGFLFGPLGESGRVAGLRARLRTFPASRAGGLLGSSGHRVDDWSEVALTLAGGAEGSVEVSRVAEGGEGSRVEIYGSRGAARLEVESGRMEVRLGATRLGVSAGGGELASRVQEAGATQALRWYGRLEHLLPTPARSLGSMGDTHLASLVYWLRAAAGLESPDGTAAGLEEGLAVEELLASVWEAAGVAG